MNDRNHNLLECEGSLQNSKTTHERVSGEADRKNRLTAAFTEPAEFMEVKRSTPRPNKGIQ